MNHPNINPSGILFKEYEETNIHRLEIQPLITKRRNRSMQFAAALSGNFRKKNPLILN